MMILGIDPGLQCTGFGVIESQSQRLRYVASGTIKTTHLPTQDLPLRIKALFDGVSQVVNAYQVDQSAIEIVFVNNNPKSSLLLGQARGACLSALVFNNLSVTEYTALQMKKSIAGHGKAQKAQVQEMVKRLLQLPGLPGPDAADALGLAITHAHAGQAMAKLSVATDLQRKTSGMYRAGRSR